MPFAMESWQKGSSDRQKLQIDKAEANVTPDKSLFKFPPARVATASGK